MGAERWIAFATKKERDRALAFLAPLGADFTVRRTIRDEPYGAQVWIRALDSGYDEQLGDGCAPCFGIEFGFSYGGDQSDDLAMLVVREMSKRFGLERIGSDSVGWYSDDGWRKDGALGRRYGAFVSWVEWSKAWVKDWSYQYRGAQASGDPSRVADLGEWIEHMEAETLEAFARLDALGRA
jgi:hypothetical protein